VVSSYRGQSRPRRQGVRHHIETYSASHQVKPVSDPFPPMSSAQFPALYTRNPIKNQYRRFMRAKTPTKARWS
jgi:hypothetical protein